MFLSSSTIETEAASKYLQQLCKHFAHKAPAEFTPERGHIAFPFGTCRLAADSNRLAIECEAPTEFELLRLQVVIDKHLVRFAWREKLEALDWRRRDAAHATGIA